MTLFEPLHPVLVNFTAALVPVSVLSDLLARWLGHRPLRAVGAWTMVYAALLTPLTALSGWRWLDDMHTSHPSLAVHKWLGTGLAAALVPLALWRFDLERRGEAPTAAYLAAAAAALAATVAQGHFGGLMTFGG